MLHVYRSEREKRKDPRKSQEKKEEEKSNQLTLQELEFLLFLIKNTTFKGEQVEFVYSTAVKLQQQYLDLKNKSLSGGIDNNIGYYEKLKEEKKYNIINDALLSLKHKSFINSSTFTILIISSING